MRSEYDLAEVLRLIKAPDLPSLVALLDGLSERVSADLFDELPAKEATIMFRLLTTERAAEVFDDLEIGTQTDLIETLGDEEIARVFDDVDADELAWLLEEAPVKVARRIQRQLPPSKLASANTLLGYPVNSIARRMSSESVTARPYETVDQVVGRVRETNADYDRLTMVPVIDDERVFLGVVSLLDLSRAMLMEPKPLIEGLYERDVPIARTTENDEVVARRALDSGALLIPVLDGEDHLLGVFPITDAAKVDRDAVAEDIARQGGSEPLRRPYLLTSVFNVAKSRIVWLLVLAISAVLTVRVLEVFEATLAEVVVLALFVPLLTGIGGNTGSQAATTVTRALGLGDVEAKDVAKVAFKELRTGAILGLILAALAFTFASPIYGMQIGAVIALTLMINCPMAATVGGVIPLVARACKVDPAVFSTPFISTFCDATGLLIYFTIARTVLGI